jgi:hypothetical protein
MAKRAQHAGFADTRIANKQHRGAALQRVA